MNSSDLKVYKAKANGRMSCASGDLVLSGVQQNVFTHVTSSQRTVGYFDYKKTFWKVADSTGGTLIDPEIYLDMPTNSLTDYVMMFTMNQTETVASITGYSTGTDTRRKYSSAYLKNAITAGDSTFTVTVKNAAMATGNDKIFAAGDIIKITDKATADALTGNETVRTITGTPSVSGSDVTITVTVAMDYGYAAYDTNGYSRVCSLIKPGNVAATATTPVVTSVAGTFDSGSYPVIVDWIGTVEQTVTLTFTDATHFTATSDDTDITGLGSGVISSDFAPNNAAFTRPYFTVELAAWGETFAAGNTVVFTTHPAAVGIGQKRVVPAASPSLANNKATQVITGEAV